jgi:hypothetical protein
MNKTEWNLDLLGKCPEELDGAPVELIRASATLVCLSHPDETAFRRTRNSKRGCRPETLQILVARAPTDRRPVNTATSNSGATG